SLSYLALRDAQALAVATFLSPERLGYPPGRVQRERLLGRIDALVATSVETAQAAAARFPGDYTVVSPGVDLELFRPGTKSKLAGLARVALEAAAAGAAIAAPPGMHEQPELAAAELARLAEDEDYRTSSVARSRAQAEGQSFATVATDLDRLYRRLVRRRRPR